VTLVFSRLGTYLTDTNFLNLEALMNFGLGLPSAVMPKSPIAVFGLISL